MKPGLLAVDEAKSADITEQFRAHVAHADFPCVGAKSAQARNMLRKVVTDGTASFAEVPGYQIAGKTGTADKPKPTGGYYDDKVINTFASIFPIDNPKYVLIVTLDEPVETSGPKPRRTAGWTAVPVAAEMVRRIAPLLGLRPAVEPVNNAVLTLTSSN